jgi:hypothetical protein
MSINIILGKPSSPDFLDLPSSASQNWLGPPRIHSHLIIGVSRLIRTILLEIKDDQHQIAQEGLRNVRDKHKPDVDSWVDIRPQRGYTVLSSLRVKRGSPSGAGTAFMRDLCKWADKWKETLVLQTANRGGGFSGSGNSQWKKTTSANRLKTFYSRFGFVSNHDKREYRPDLEGNMHREPE